METLLDLIGLPQLEGNDRITISPTDLSDSWVKYSDGPYLTIRVSTLRKFFFWWRLQPNYVYPHIDININDNLKEVQEAVDRVVENYRKLKQAEALAETLLSYS